MRSIPMAHARVIFSVDTACKIRLARRIERRMTYSFSYFPTPMFRDPYLDPNLWLRPGAGPLPGEPDTKPVNQLWNDPRGTVPKPNSSGERTVLLAPTGGDTVTFGTIKASLTLTDPGTVFTSDNRFSTVENTDVMGDDTDKDNDKTSITVPTGFLQNIDPMFIALGPFVGPGILSLMISAGAGAIVDPTQPGTIVTPQTDETAAGTGENVVAPSNPGNTVPGQSNSTPSIPLEQIPSLTEEKPKGK